MTENAHSAAACSRLIDYIQQADGALEGENELTQDDLFLVKRGVAAASILAKRASSDRLAELAAEMRGVYQAFIEERDRPIAWEISHDDIGFYD